MVQKTATYQWALRIGTELVAATMLGLSMGYMLDLWFGTGSVEFEELECTGIYT